MGQITNNVSFKVYVGNNTHISFNDKNISEFRRLTQRAANQKKEKFDFEGTEFLTEYAQYLVPIISNKRQEILNKEQSTK